MSNLKKIASVVKNQILSMAKEYPTTAPIVNTNNTSYCNNMGMVSISVSFKSSDKASEDFVKKAVINVLDIVNDSVSPIPVGEGISLVNNIEISGKSIDVYIAYTKGESSAMMGVNPMTMGGMGMGYNPMAMMGGNPPIGGMTPPTTFGGSPRPSQSKSESGMSAKKPVKLPKVIKYLSKDISNEDKDKIKSLSKSLGVDYIVSVDGNEYPVGGNNTFDSSIDYRALSEELGSYSEKYPECFMENALGKTIQELTPDQSNNL